MNIGYTLSKDVDNGFHTAFCRFIPRCDGIVTILTFATYTDYNTSFTVDGDEARACWRRLSGEGYKRDADSEAFWSRRRAERAPEENARLRCGAHARLAA
jgi:hypothetical protein